MLTGYIPHTHQRANADADPFLSLPRNQDQNYRTAFKAQCQDNDSKNLFAAYHNPVFPLEESGGRQSVVT